jgi:hypothetical protein
MFCKMISSRNCSRLACQPIRDKCAARRDLTALCNRYTKRSCFLCGVTVLTHGTITASFTILFHNVCYPNIDVVVFAEASSRYHGTGTRWGWRKAVRHLLSSLRKFPFESFNGAYEGGPKRNRNFLIKNCVFIFRCYKLNLLQSTAHLMQYNDSEANKVLWQIVYQEIVFIVTIKDKL